MDKMNDRRIATTAAQIGSRVGMILMVMQRKDKEMIPIIPYHHRGTSG